MNSPALSPHLDELRKRILPEGGFSGRPGGNYRPDATAWAILAMTAANVEPGLLSSARRRLAKSQLEDGRVPIAPGFPEVIWPTPIAILAWHGDQEHDVQKSKAIDFMIRNSGVHWQKKPDSPVSHDTAIRGWPWVLGTHSWIEPTALTIVALRVSGYGEHDRTREAMRMLLDRQLPGGGWNYGNTRVFGKELEPMPEDTGVALAALGGVMPKEPVNASLTYLSNNLGNLLTPLALGYGVLGLSAYGARPAQAEASILRCLARQTQFGSYDSTMISLLLFAFVAKDGIIRFLDAGGRRM